MLFTCQANTKNDYCLNFNHLLFISSIHCLFVCVQRVFANLPLQKLQVKVASTVALGCVETKVRKTLISIILPTHCYSINMHLTKFKMFGVELTF